MKVYSDRIMKLLNLTLILWTTIAFATSLPTDTKYTLDDLIKILNGISEDGNYKFSSLN